MQQRETLSKAIRYQKAASDNAFSIISIFQTSGEQMLKTTLDQCSWIPEKGKNDYLSWSQNYVQMTEKMKSYIDKGYEEAERLFVRAEKTAPEQNETSVQLKNVPTPPVATKQNAGATKQNAAKQEKSAD